MGQLEVFNGVDRRLLVPFSEEEKKRQEIEERDPTEESGPGGTGGFDDTVRQEGGLTQSAKGKAGGVGGAGGATRFIANPDFAKQKELLERLEKEITDVGYCIDKVKTFKDGVKEIVQDAFLRAKELATAVDEEEYSVLPVCDSINTEIEVSYGSMAEYLGIERSVQKEISTIKRKLINIVTNETYARWITGADRGRRIDPKLIARIPLGERNFFKFKVESNILDLVVVLLVDESGSMWGNKCLEARRCAVMFGNVLDAIKVPNEIIGFSTTNLTYEQNDAAARRGYTNIVYNRALNLAHYMYKRFDEEWARVKTRLVHITARSENFDQDDIEFAWKRALHYAAVKGITRKLVIVISDGMPVGGTAARQKLIRVVNTIGCDPNADIVGLGIQTPYVKDFYHKNVEIDDVSQLGMNVVRLQSSAILKRRVKV